jgi:hypothetical protein
MQDSNQGGNPRCVATRKLWHSSIADFCFTTRFAETRTRRDRIELQNQGFEDQIPDLVGAYMLWRSKLGQASLEKAGPVVGNKETASSTRLIQVLDIYGT